ncbi:hypothetical protein EPK99_13080 [Neorhizobium lilium]|uniref:Uncharacterized protein n=1 Tax=Neorhizobium lilium TaxID=2503024 RepID=A0A444LEI0_9HYPH|nr:hypothetical protein [Neorhizobium lilium]RWX76616.1 hypothetical protein EPK99_13080 [Neorhizobium lilium]
MTETNSRNGDKTEGSIQPDLEARVVVLEIVSMTALALALDTSETADAEHARGIASLILDTVRQRCHEVGMDEPARLSACSYADELLSTALVSLYPE